MTTLVSSGISGWPGRAEAWLDARGKAAWIAATVAGFVVFWPVGLALLGYMIWSKRMFTRTARDGRACRTVRSYDRAWSTSGNTAFDAYKADTLRRLEEEQMAFESFLQRLRDAKDKQEFDDFMADRARGAQLPPVEPEAPRA